MLPASDCSLKRLSLTIGPKHKRRIARGSRTVWALHRRAAQTKANSTIRVVEVDIVTGVCSIRFGCLSRPMIVFKNECAEDLMLTGGHPLGTRNQGSVSLPGSRIFISSLYSVPRHGDMVSTESSASSAALTRDHLTSGVHPYSWSAHSLEIANYVLPALSCLTVIARWRACKMIEEFFWAHRTYASRAQRRGGSICQLV